MKKKKSGKQPAGKPFNAKRTKRIVFVLNEYEEEALTSYCQKYKIKNRSGMIRHILLSHIMKRFDEDYPTLF